MNSPDRQGQRAAVYARKSTEQEKGASGDSLSIERQVAQAERFAALRGWSIVHVYKDEAISGTEYVNRPGYLAMMDALKDFDVLIVAEQSRLGRDTARALLAIEALEEAGVEVWTYNGERISVADEGGEMQATLRGLIDKQEARRASTRTRAKMAELARAGHWTGSRIFGYDRERVNGHVELRVNEAEAAIVRTIFQWSAQGLGINRIARRLGAEYPGLRKWSAQGVRDVLVNETYIGALVYGRTQTVRRKGKKVRIAQPDSSQWIKAERPELRIVPQALWDAAQARKAATFSAYLRGPGGRLSGKPEGSALASKYLLSGMMVCDHCGGKLVVWSHAGRNPRYLCGTHRGRGPAGCANKYSIAADEIEGLVAAGLRDEILTPARIEALRADLAREAAGAPEQIAAQRQALEAGLGKVEQKIARLTEAVAEGGALKSLLDGIKAAEREQRDLRAKLAALDGLERASQDWSDDTRTKVAAVLKDWQGALTGSPLVARQILRKLLAGPIRVQMSEGGAWSFAAACSYGQLLGGTDGDELMIVRASNVDDARPDVDLGAVLKALAQDVGGGVKAATIRSVSPGGRGDRWAAGLVLTGKVA